MNLPYIIAGAVVLFSASAVILISYITYKLTFSRGKQTTDPYDLFGKNAPYDYEDFIRGQVTRLLAMPYEQVAISSHDGLRLVGKLYLTDGRAPVEILLHGYRSLAERDFAGGVCEALDRGHNALLIDQRAHGNSEGKTISFGALEKKDCLGWIDFVRGRFGEDTEIILIGLSMGAATVLLASAENLPDNVKGIIADCPYSSAKEIITMEGYKQGFPMRICYPFLKLGARLFGRFSISDAEPIAVIDKARVPILLIHGEADDFVPYDMSLRLKERNPDISHHGFKGAEHGTSYCVDRERYISLVEDFFKDLLGKSQGCDRT